MEERRSFAAPLATAIVLVTLGLYVGGHFALLEPRPFVISGGTPPWPQYKLGGEPARIFFWPVWKVDLWLDHQYWNWFGDDETQADLAAIDRTVPSREFEQYSRNTLVESLQSQAAAQEVGP